MLRLYLLRHMKTAWALPGQKDIDRQLNEIGVSDLGIARNWIKDKSIQPKKIYCSPAARTRETLEGLMSALPDEVDIEIRDNLYSGFVSEYMDCLQNETLQDDIMIIGHNPTCASLANILVGSGEPAAVNTISYKYPTGAMAIIEFDVDQWNEISENAGRLVEFLMPKPYRQ